MDAISFGLRPRLIVNCRAAGNSDEFPSTQSKGHLAMGKELPLPRRHVAGHYAEIRIAPPASHGNGLSLYLLTREGLKRDRVQRYCRQRIISEVPRESGEEFPFISGPIALVEDF